MLRCITNWLRVSGSTQSDLHQCTQHLHQEQERYQETNQRVQSTRLVYNTNFVLRLDCHKATTTATTKAESIPATAAFNEPCQHPSPIAIAPYLPHPPSHSPLIQVRPILNTSNPTTFNRMTANPAMSDTLSNLQTNLQHPIQHWSTHQSMHSSMQQFSPSTRLQPPVILQSLNPTTLQ